MLQHIQYRHFFIFFYQNSSCFQQTKLIYRSQHILHTIATALSSALIPRSAL